MFFNKSWQQPFFLHTSPQSIAATIFRNASQQSIAAILLQVYLAVKRDSNHYSGMPRCEEGQKLFSVPSCQQSVARTILQACLLAKRYILRTFLATKRGSYHYLALPCSKAWRQPFFWLLRSEALQPLFS